MTIASKTPLTIHGIAGLLDRSDHSDGRRFLRQKWKGEGRPFKGGGYGRNAMIHPVLRYDDDCKNGHNSFAVTASISGAARRDDNGSMGCAHDDLARAFPELRHLIKWHLSDGEKGPMHGVANAIYHASNRDHNGLLEGETRQIVNGRSGLPSWQLVPVGADPLDPIPMHHIAKSTDCAADDLPPVPKLEWRPWCHVGKGKARNLDAARSSAVWLDAPDDVLMLPADELRPILEARIPALLASFRADIEAAGLSWTPAGD